ncbi:MAG: hypothetical protein JO270_26090 [Acidobacteriaceae bacterium]|nr:hypothetical protein [Acidobacteriaceae bacterium]
MTPTRHLRASPSHLDISIARGWRFDKQRRLFKAHVNVPLTVSELRIAVTAATDGKGPTQLPLPYVAPELAAWRAREDSNS